MKELNMMEYSDVIQSVKGYSQMESNKNVITYINAYTVGIISLTLVWNQCIGFAVIMFRKSLNGVYSFRVYQWNQWHIFKELISEIQFFLISVMLLECLHVL